MHEAQQRSACRLKALPAYLPACWSTRAFSTCPWPGMGCTMKAATLWLPSSAAMSASRQALTLLRMHSQYIATLHWPAGVISSSGSLQAGYVTLVYAFLCERASSAARSASRQAVNLLYMHIRCITTCACVSMVCERMCKCMMVPRMPIASLCSTIEVSASGTAAK